MEVIYEFGEGQIKDLHKLYQREWWTKGRSLIDTKACVEGSQICIGIVDDFGRLLASVDAVDRNIVGIGGAGQTTPPIAPDDRRGA